MPSALARPLARLIDELSKLPGVGPKTAQRLAYFILRTNVADAEALAADRLGGVTGGLKIPGM